MLDLWPRSSLIRAMMESYLFHRNFPEHVTAVDQALHLILRDIIIINLDKQTLDNSGRVDNLKAFQSHCDAHLFRCRFQETIYPCADIFTVSLTHHGVCCTFNNNNNFK